MAPPFLQLLQVPSIDGLVAALASSSSYLAGDRSEGLKPDEKKSNLSFRNDTPGHRLGHPFSISLPSSGSNSYRPDCLLVRSVYLTKIVVAVQFSADATLHAAKYSFRALASTVTFRRVLWL